MACALACALSFNARFAAALITVEPGTYEVPAFLTAGESGPVAIFNWNTRSQCRIRLTGKLARSLRLRAPRALLIQVRVTRKIEGMDGTAQLLEVRALGKRKLPRSVLNNLKPGPENTGSR